jgi:hypothetical protein
MTNKGKGNKMDTKEQDEWNLNSNDEINATAI